jgi:hypothetical protein
VTKYSILAISYQQSAISRQQSAVSRQVIPAADYLLAILLVAGQYKPLNLIADR